LVVPADLRNFGCNISIYVDTYKVWGRGRGRGRGIPRQSVHGEENAMF